MRARSGIGCARHEGGAAQASPLPPALHYHSLFLSPDQARTVEGDAELHGHPLQVRVVADDAHNLAGELAGLVADEEVVEAVVGLADEDREALHLAAERVAAAARGGGGEGMGGRKAGGTGSFREESGGVYAQARRFRARLGGPHYTGTGHIYIRGTRVRAG